MLTDRQETLIDDSLPAVSEHFDKIAQRMYDILFERYPQTRPLFNESHLAAGTQQRALAGAVLAYVQWRKRSDDPVCRNLAVTADKHVALDIQPEQYPMVGECLLAAVGEQLGDALTDDIAAAWQALYNELADLMIGLEKDAKQAFLQRSGGWQAWRAFEIAERRVESEDVVSFVFAPKDGLPVGDYRPGQFIGLRVLIDDEPVYRQYSLSAPPNGLTYRLSVKHEPKGRVSGHLHEQMSTGDGLELLPSGGELTLDAGNQPVMLISGGVGQTPMISLAHRALSQGRRVVYLHSAKDSAHHALAGEVAAMAANYPTLMTSILVYSRADSRAASGADHTGYIDHKLLERYLPSLEASCYFAGPQGLMQTVDRSLRALGVPERNRRYEHFGPAQPLDDA